MILLPLLIEVIAVLTFGEGSVPLPKRSESDPLYNASAACHPLFADWCDECDSLIGPFDVSLLQQVCVNDSALARLVPDAPYPAFLVDSAQPQRWFVTHGTLAWDVWQKPSYTMDLGATTPSMTYSAGMYSHPAQDCCKYTYLGGPEREECARRSDNTMDDYVPYPMDGFSMLEMYTVHLPNGTSPRVPIGTGELVQWTVLDWDEQHMLVYLCVYPIIPVKWGPLFQILSRSWDLSEHADTISRYLEKIHTHVDPSIQFYPNLD